MALAPGASKRSVKDAVAVQRDRSRFKEDLKALRLALQQRQHLPELTVDDRPTSSDRPPVVVIEHREPPQRRYEQTPHGFSPSLIRAAKLVSLCAVMAAVYWGPSYYTCRQLKEGGFFFFDQTMKRCVEDRMAARTDPFKELSARLLGVL